MEFGFDRLVTGCGGERTLHVWAVSRHYVWHARGGSVHSPPRGLMGGGRSLKSLLLCNSNEPFTLRAYLRVSVLRFAPHQCERPLFHSR